jgi:hypothetical protein
MVAGDDGGPIFGRLARKVRHPDLAGAAKVAKVKSWAMILNAPYDSNQSQTVELNRRNLQKRKVWIKPEFRQLEFMATAAAAAGANDGNGLS